MVYTCGVTSSDIAMILAAAFTGGALNAVAGGGSFVTLPALIAAGVPAVSANATSSMALWPGVVASTLAYRRDFDVSRRLLIALSATSLVGGVLGALLLLGTSNAAFLRLLPVLMLIASLTFTFGGWIAKRRRSTTSGATSATATVAACVLQLAIATYGGYFGGGMGIMMLAYLVAIGMTNIHAMNGVKSLLAAIINGVAIIAFVWDGVVAWRPGLVMIAATITGGWVGARAARKVPIAAVRGFVMIVGWTMTAYFAWRAYR